MRKKKGLRYRGKIMFYKKHTAPSSVKIPGTFLLRRYLVSLVLGCWISCFEFCLPPAFAGDIRNVNYVERGFYRILSAPFALPKELFRRTFSGPLIVGTVDGALTGAFSTVSSLLGGVFDIVRGVIPYAKYAPFFLL